MKLLGLLLCAALVAQAVAAGQRKLLGGADLLSADGADAATLAAAAKSSSADSGSDSTPTKAPKHCKGAVFEACCTLPITFASQSTKVTAPLSCTVEEAEDDKHASLHKPWTVVIGSGPEASLAAEGSNSATKSAGTAADAADTTSAAGASAAAEGFTSTATESKSKGKTYELELADPSVPLTWVGEVDGEEFSCICFNPVDAMAVAKWAESTPPDLSLGKLAGKDLPAGKALSLVGDAAAQLAEAAGSAGPGDK